MSSTPKKEESRPDISSAKPVTDEAILKVAKEVVVKFIEIGRLSPANFDEIFKSIHQTVKEAVRKSDA